MGKHVTDDMYDYLRGGLPEPVRRRIEEHLHDCLKCTIEVEEIRTIIDLGSESADVPSASRSDLYWQHFPDRVAVRIQETNPARRRQPLSVSEFIRGLFDIRPAHALALASSVSVLFIVILLFLTAPDRPGTDTASGNRTESVIMADGRNEMDERMADFMRKSKSLLIGLSNLPEDADHPIDLSAERRISRDLVDEARLLRRQPLDLRSAKLLNELDKVMIELSNTDEGSHGPDIDMIRSGIAQQNLLFKVRMSESMYRSARFVMAGNSQ